MFNMRGGSGEKQIHDPSESVGPKSDGPWGTPKLTVESYDNHVYFYSYVDPDRGLALLKTIRERDNSIRSEKISRDTPNAIIPIWLHINSGGGDLMTAFSISDQLKTIKTPIYSIVEGLTASASTIISLSCTRRLITPSSFFLIHQFWSMMWGKYEEFKDEMHLQNMMMENMVKFYAWHTKLTPDKIKVMLAHDSWFNAKECMKFGFADEIKK